MTIADAIARQRTEPELPPYIDLRRVSGCDGGYRTLLACASGERPVEAVIAAHGALRRCAASGGAGFPAGRKWHIVRAEPAPRLMAVNIDEGEPGTFKDRVLSRARSAPLPRGHADRGVGGRHRRRSTSTCATSMHGCRAILDARARARCRRIRPAPLPPIHLRRGAGAYICGEESAMIESIEGKRGMPRLRPPYVAQVGLFGRPTLEHNMETLYWVRDILEKGAEWFAGHGRNGRKGLRSFSVSGRVAKPGVHLAPAGITVRELIDEYCGGMLAGHELLRLPAGRRVGRHPAGVAGRHPARLRYAAAARLLHRLGGGDRAFAARPARATRRST